MVANRQGSEYQGGMNREWTHGSITGDWCGRAGEGNNTMAKGYWITSYRSISNPEKLAAYAKLAPPAIAPFGGRYLARGSAAAAYEAGLKERIVISEFPSVEQAIAAHDSPAYQEALKALGNGAVRDLRIVEGLE
jgi:uncharacterized protein (DUF1330 family)